MRSCMILEVSPSIEFIVQTIPDEKLGFIRPREISEDLKLSFAIIHGLYTVKSGVNREYK